MAYVPWKIHALDRDHKRSRNNPGEPHDIDDDRYGYRTGLCGQARHCKRGKIKGHWVNQFNELNCVDAELIGHEPDTECGSCIRIARQKGLI